MKPGMLGKVHQRLADVVNGENMITGEEEEERDEIKTECEDEELMSEEVQNEIVIDVKAESIPNKLETSNEQCAAGIVLPKLEMVNSFKLEIKSEKSKEVSENSGFLAETERSKAKYCCAEFAEDLRRRARVLLEPCALLLSPTPTPTFCKIENETDEENSLGETANSRKLENKSDKPRESEKCEFEFESERSNFTEFDEVLRRKAIVVLERCVLPASSSETPMNECKLKLKNETDGENSVSAETEGEEPKIKIETAEENGLGFSDGAEKCRQVEVTTRREMDAPQQHIYKTEIKNEVVEDELEIIFESYVTNVKTKIRREPIDENKVDFTSQGGNENVIRVNIEDAREKISFEDVRRKREASAQREKCLATNAESIRRKEELEPADQDEEMAKHFANWKKLMENKVLEHRKKRLSYFTEYRRKRKENKTSEQYRMEKETPEQRKERLAKQAEYRRKRMENETPEQREKRLTYFNEYTRKRRQNETLEKRQKRFAQKYEYKRKRIENETPEQREKRRAKQVEYWRKWTERKKLKQGEKCQAPGVEKRGEEMVEREMPQQLDKYHLTVAEISKKVIKVEAMNIDDHGLSHFDGEENNTADTMKNEPIDEDEVDLYSQDGSITRIKSEALNYYAIKSEADFVVEEEDEMEIDFEAVMVTNAETENGDKNNKVTIFF